MKATLKTLIIAIIGLLTSCAGISGTLNIPLPDRLGGGTLPITIQPEK